MRDNDDVTARAIARLLKIANRQALRVHAELVDMGGATRESLERYLSERMREPIDVFTAPRCADSIARRLVDVASSHLERLRLQACCSAKGFTYLIQGAGVIKIGRSDRPLDRVAGLQTMSPIELRFLALARDASFEQRLHAFLASDRSHGEWFHADRVLERTATMRAYASSKDVCLRCAFEVTR